MRQARHPLLQIGGVLLLMAAALHVAACFAGPAFIAALGAPPDIVRSAAAGTALAPAVIAAIAGVLLAGGLCAFAVAGQGRRRRGARAVLYAFAAVFLLRALALPVMLVAVPASRGLAGPVEMIATAACVTIGMLLLLGVRGVPGRP